VRGLTGWGFARSGGWRSGRRRGLCGGGGGGGVPGARRGFSEGAERRGSMSGRSLARGLGSKMGK